MSFLEKLMSNKLVKNQILGQITEAVKENGIKHIHIVIKEDGSFEPVLYKDEIKILTIDEYNKLIEALKSNI